MSPQKTRKYSEEILRNKPKKYTKKPTKTQLKYQNPSKPKTPENSFQNSSVNPLQMHSPTPKMKQRKRRGSKEKETTQHRTKQWAPSFFVLLIFLSCHSLTYSLHFLFSQTYMNMNAKQRRIWKQRKERRAKSTHRQYT